LKGRETEVYMLFVLMVTIIVSAFLLWCFHSLYDVELYPNALSVTGAAVAFWAGLRVLRRQRGASGLLGSTYRWAWGCGSRPRPFGLPMLCCWVSLGSSPWQTPPGY